MKIGMTSLTLRQYSVAKTAECAALAGLDGIEWGISENHMQLGDIKRASEIKDVSKDYGLEIFSLGSYCYMESRSECDINLETASILGAPIIRVWAGKQGTLECKEAMYNTIIANTKYMAEQAEKLGIVIGFEYHGNSLTDSAINAVKFIRDVNHKNAKLYWQPESAISPSDNLENFKTVIPYLCGNLHIHNYTRQNGYMMLSDISENIKSYFSDVKDKEYNLMIEFVRDSSLENLMHDARTIKNALGL